VFPSLSQGTPGNLFYILESGQTEVIKDGAKVGVIGERRAFGELALLNGTNRAATIRAIAPCQLWTLDRKTFRSVLATKEMQKKSERAGLLRNVKLFEKLTDLSLNQLADAIQEVTYPAGQRIIKQGEVLIMMVSTRNMQFANGRLSGRRRVLRHSKWKCCG
jgi:cAMP-dependent protein kinase regulator